MAKVKVIKDKDGNKVYPITSENAVLDSDGKSVGSKLKSFELKVGEIDTALAAILGTSESEE